MKKAGFTLVELMAVVVILGILAAVGIPQYRRTMERARGAEAYIGLAQINSAEKIHYTVNQEYTATLGNLDVSLRQDAWTFTLNVPTGGQTFTATFTRKAGSPCTSQTITIDQTGTITDNWKGCVNTASF